MIDNRIERDSRVRMRDPKRQKDVRERENPNIYREKPQRGREILPHRERKIPKRESSQRNCERDREIIKKETAQKKILRRRRYLKGEIQRNRAKKTKEKERSQRNRRIPKRE